MPMHYLMRNRPGERARHEVRRAWRHTVRKNVTPGVCLILFAIIFCEAISLLPLPTSWRAFLFGFVAASVLACLAWIIHILSGSHGWTLGKLGEEATAEAVTNRRQRHKGWRLINGLYLARHGDIDHILVGPGGVFVIESKWTASPCRIVRGSIVGLLGREPVAQARDGAQKVERMLRHGHQQFDVTVQPVVVLWGPGGLRLDQGWMTVDGVLVCEGRRQKSWLRRLDCTVLDQPMVEQVTGALVDQITRQVDQPVP
jgi:hypothetical protein